MSDAYEGVGKLAGLLGADHHPGLVGLNHVRQSLGRLNLADEVDLVKGLAGGGSDLSDDDERADPLFCPRMRRVRRLLVRFTLAGPLWLIHPRLSARRTWPGHAEPRYFDLGD
jgi:hypothetical protein